MTGTSKSRTVIVLVFGLALLVPSVAVAEVMDKEPPAAQFWWWALTAGLLGAANWRFLPKWPAAAIGRFLFVIGAVYFLSVLSEVLDPFAGPAILREAGPGYPAQAWAAASLFVLLHVLGFVTWRRRYTDQALQPDAPKRADYTGNR
jgi:hypothetical protein